MKVLVMGGTQFVSSAVAKHMIKKGYEVDIFTRGMRPVEFTGYRNHLKGDRKSIENLRGELEGRRYDYIFDISAYTKEDVERLVSVVDRSSLKNYIFCSSGSVYEETEELAGENFPRGMNKNWGDYGLNKKKAEDYLFELHEKEGFPVTIFRPTYIYGEGNNLYREVFLFDRITKGLPIAIPAGNKRNQFIHIEDLAKTFESAMYSKRAIGKGYNLTHPEEITWKDLCTTAMEVVGKKVEIKEIDYWGRGIEPRSFFPFRDVTYLLDMKKLKEDGLYEPKLVLEDGLGKAYEWYCKENPKLKDGRMVEVNIEE